MKKLYSFVTVAIFSVSVSAQTNLLTEDFSSITSGSNTTANGSSSQWSGNSNFPTASSAFQAGGAVRVGASSSVGSITSKTLNLSTDGGAFILKFDVKGWSTVEGDIIVKITGLTDKAVTYTSVMTGNFQTIILNYTGGQANSKITIGTSAKRAFIDNVSVVTDPASLAATDFNKTKKSLIKNNVVENEIVFTAKSDIKVYNINGQVVKTASVNENTSINISELPKGIYIVSATVDGQAVSQKIIKK